MLPHEQKGPKGRQKTKCQWFRSRFRRELSPLDPLAIGMQYPVGQEDWTLLDFSVVDQKKSNFDRSFHLGRQAAVFIKK